MQKHISEDKTSPQINQVHFVKIVIRQCTYIYCALDLKKTYAGLLGITVQGTDHASIDAGQLQLTGEGQLTLQCNVMVNLFKEATQMGVSKNRGKTPPKWIKMDGL